LKWEGEDEKDTHEWKKQGPHPILVSWAVESVSVTDRTMGGLITWPQRSEKPEGRLREAGQNTLGLPRRTGEWGTIRHRDEEAGQETQQAAKARRLGYPKFREKQTDREGNDTKRGKLRGLPTGTGASTKTQFLGGR